MNFQVGFDAVLGASLVWSLALCLEDSNSHNFVGIGAFRLAGAGARLRAAEEKQRERV